MRDLQAKTRTGGDTTLPEATIEQFKAHLRGALIQPGDADYDVARTVHNAMIDRSPALIARCANVADVITAVKVARKHDLI